MVWAWAGYSRLLFRMSSVRSCAFFFFFQAEDGIRDLTVTGVQTCALPIYNGNSNITISNVTVTGAGFSVGGVTPGMVLTPSQSLTLNIAFAPASVGSATDRKSVV